MKKSYKCHCGKTYGTSPSLRKHAAQCPSAAAVTAQVKDILNQKETESSANVNNNNSNSINNNLIQHYSSSIALKQISASTPATSLKTLVVSTKSSPTETVQTVQQPQRLMIQLAELNTITA